MDILYFLIPLALLITGFFFGIFAWSVKNKQFEDLDTPPYRILNETEREQK